jgi:hypothetical protein
MELDSAPIQRIPSATSMYLCEVDRVIWVMSNIFWASLATLVYLSLNKLPPP